MTRMLEFVLTGGIIKSLNSVGSWSGETHIQKSCYVAKHVKSVPFKSEFMLYKHGPYSFDLNVVLHHMRGQNIIDVVPQGTYGSSFTLNEGLWMALNRAAGNAFGQFADTIGEVCEILGRKRVGELERIATAIYVKINFPELKPRERPRKLVELKPHIELDDAIEAFEEAAALT